MSNLKKIEKPQLIKAYIISIIILCAGIVGMLFWKQVFSLTEVKSIFGVLSDAFFVPGIIFVGIGGISRLAAAGAYDTIGYLFSRLALHSLWVTGAKRKKYDSLYEYKVAKDEKGRSWLPYLLWSGVVSCGISIILLVIYLVL